jgi:hypothetical protein
MEEQDRERDATMAPGGAEGLREEPMVRQDRWEEIRRLHRQERRSVSEIARQVRRALHGAGEEKGGSR